MGDSAARKASNARYWRSERGKATKAAKAARYRTSPKGRATIAAWNELHHEKHRAQTKAWQKTYQSIARNSDKGRDQRVHFETIRRARKRLAPGTHSAAEWRAKRDSYGGLCHWCGKPARLSMDHIIPLSRGGSNSIDNLAPSCTHCNSSKGSKTPDEWQKVA